MKPAYYQWVSKDELHRPPPPFVYRADVVIDVFVPLDERPGRRCRAPLTAPVWKCFYRFVSALTPSGLYTSCFYKRVPPAQILLVIPSHRRRRRYEAPLVRGDVGLGGHTYVRSELCVCIMKFSAAFLSSGRGDSRPNRDPGVCGFSKHVSSGPRAQETRREPLEIR